MRLKTFKHLALVSAMSAALAACGGGSDSGGPMVASVQDDSATAWVETPASIKWEGADAESAAALKERRWRGNRDSRRGSDSTTAASTTATTESATSTSTSATTVGGTSTATDGSNSTDSTDSSNNSNNSSNSSNSSNNSNNSDTSNGSNSNSNTDSNTTSNGNSTTDASNTDSSSDKTDTANNSNSNSDNSAQWTESSSGSASGPAGAAAGSYGAVTFDEEWNGPLDTSKWGTRMHHWTNPDLDNFKIENGELKMWTPLGADGLFEFENRAMNTEGLFNQLYGWFEMEAKLPPGSSLWPSFWLYGVYGQDRPEIDIMESYGGLDAWWGDPNPIDYGATVWLGRLDGNHERLGMFRPSHYGIAPQDLTKAFHKYGVKWDPEGIQFYFDGQPFGEKVHTSRMNRELFIIVGLSTGRYGTYNAPKASTPTNSEYIVNYVRAWALPGGVTTVNGRTIH